MPVFCFRSSEADGVTLWVGDEDCQAAHEGVVSELRMRTSVRLRDDQSLDERTKGNLGEFISLFVGNATKYATCHAFPANALSPLSGISKPEVDILWLSFGATSADDYAVVQEVKTTTALNLDYARSLISDYEKLFGTDIRLTLKSRLEGSAGLLTYSHRRPDLGVRATELAGVSAATSPLVHLTPTLVHDRAVGDAHATLTAVRSVLVAKQNWQLANIDMWSIALSGLDARLLRIARGQN